jgi:hypothetical protein
VVGGGKLNTSAPDFKARASGRCGRGGAAWERAS